MKRKECDKRKLAPIADGPFLVTKVGTNTVTFKFPSNSRAHPIVNTSRVQLYFGLRPKLTTVPPDDDAGHEYEVDEILGHQCKNRKEYYYIHWKGYPAEDDSWEPRENLLPETIIVWEKSTKL